jgi:putative transposase
MTLHKPTPLDLPASVLVAPGTPIEWAGEMFIISNVDLAVTLTDGQGRPSLEIPYASAVEALQRDESQAEYNPALHLIDDMELDANSGMPRPGRRQLSKAAQSKLKWVRETLCILSTGLTTEDHPQETPPPELDPRLNRYLSDRVSVLARLRSEKLQTSGPKVGQRIEYKSERKRIERLLAAWQTGGEPACIDVRIGGRNSRQSDALRLEMRDWALGRPGESNISTTAAVVNFVADRVACGSGDEGLPSPRTMWQMFKDLQDQYPRLLKGSARMRESNANVPDPTDFRRESSRPGELVLFDTTKANVHIVDPRTGRTYRPEITIALDHYTRAIVGMSISIITSGISVALCLADVLRVKTETAVADWCIPGDDILSQPYIGTPNEFVRTRAFGRNDDEPGTWGVVGAIKPEKAIVDNGRTFISAYMTAQMSRLRIHMQPQRTYTPTDKAQVERAFRTIKDMFESLMPGYTGGSVFDRGSNAAAGNLMTATLYERRLRQCIDIYNNKVNKGLVVRDDPFVRMTPFMMWRYAIKNIGPIKPPPSKHDWIHLLPSTRVVISAGGFRLNRLQYNHPTLLRRLAGNTTLAKGRQLRVFHNPSDLRFVWTFDEAGNPQKIHWTHWQEGMPRFGEMATSGAIRELGATAMTDRRLFRYLTRTAAGWRAEDASTAAAGHHEVDDAFERIVAAYDELETDQARQLLDTDLYDMQLERARPNNEEPALQYSPTTDRPSEVQTEGPTDEPEAPSDSPRQLPTGLGTFDRFSQ